MKKYDLVEGGKVIKQNVRFNVCTNHEGHREVHADVVIMTEADRCDCGIYNRIDPAPVYDGRYERIGSKSSGVIGDFMVTYTTQINSLGLNGCKEYLSKVVRSYHVASALVDCTGYDIDAVLQSHLDNINALSLRAEAITYDTFTGWPLEPIN